MAQPDYKDHASVEDSELPAPAIKQQRKGPRGGVKVPFPKKLYSLLEENLFEDVISWQPHGRSFLVRKPTEFVNNVMPRYFQQSKMTSFQRQLNLYGFTRLLASGPDKGGYYHELFLRGKSNLCPHILRTRIKGPTRRVTPDPNNEPRFYKMEFLPESKPISPARRTTIVPLNSEDVPTLCVSCSLDFDESSCGSHHQLESPSDVAEFDDFFTCSPIPSNISLEIPFLDFPSLSRVISGDISAEENCKGSQLAPRVHKSYDDGHYYENKRSTVGQRQPQYYEKSKEEPNATALENALQLEAQEKMNADPSMWIFDFDLSTVFD